MEKAVGADRIRTKSQTGKRDNNFTMVRMIATVFVFGGHMGMIVDGDPPFLGSFFLHEIGVGMLFLIGGYLITISWLSDPDPLRYAIRRFFRLWPPFAVMVLIMVFVSGPLLSDMGAAGYFGSWYELFLRNLRFYIVFAQPGVFSDLPLPHITNGSLWTMPVEAFLYIITPLMLTALRVRKRRKASFRSAAIVTGVMFAFDLVLRALFDKEMVVVYGTDLISAFHLIVWYMFGMLFTYEQARNYLNMQIACVGMCVLFLTQFAWKPFQYFLLLLIFPYVVFSFVFAARPVFRNVGRKLEPSYGIYLYGFFFQQLVVSFQMHHGIQPRYMTSFLISGLLTLGAAILSYYLVEQPAQRLSGYLIKRLKQRQGIV